MALQNNTFRASKCYKYNISFLYKNSSLGLDKTTLQVPTFTLKCGSIKRKCVRMIQPVSAFSPRAEFRGSGKAYGKPSKGLSSSGIALINAGGIALSAGGLTTAVARSYTSSWSHAGVLGICGAFLSMFFMTPHLIEKAISNKHANSKEASIVKEDSQKVVEAVKEHLKPARKLVQFRQQS